MNELRIGQIGIGNNEAMKDDNLAGALGMTFFGGVWLIFHKANDQVFDEMSENYLHGLETVERIQKGQPQARRKGKAK